MCPVPHLQFGQLDKPYTIIVSKSQNGNLGQQAEIVTMLLLLRFRPQLSTCSMYCNGKQKSVSVCGQELTRRLPKATSLHFGS